MRSASQSFLAASGTIAAGQVIVPFTSVPPRAPDGGFTTLQGIRIKLNFIAGTIAGGTNASLSLYDVISSMTLGVAGGDGVHGPALLSGGMMRALESALTGWDKIRRTIGTGEGTDAAGAFNRAVTVDIPFDRVGAARADYSRTIVSLQAGAAQLAIQFALAGRITVLGPTSNFRVEFILGSTKEFVATPRVRYGFYGIQSLVGGTLPAAAWRALLLNRLSAVGAAAPTAFTTGDVTRLDLSVGGQQLVFNGNPEDWATNWPPFVGTAAAPISSPTFCEPPSDANGFNMRVWPFDGFRQAATDLPVGQPIYTIGTTLTASQLQWIGASISPLSQADIISQITAQGADAGAVQEALSKDRYYSPGAKGRPPGKDVSGLLPIIVQL
jgi:hypothetical protein